MKNVIDFYNKTANWSDLWLDEKKQAKIVEKFYDCFASGGTLKPRILDIGCGAGYDSKLAYDLGAKVVGVDLSENLINIAKEEVKGPKFFVGDITDKFVSLGKFDGIMCLATIMHVDIENMRNVFSNMAQVLKKGGLLLISSFDGSGKNIEKSLASIDGETYDKNFNNYSASELCVFAYPKLKLVDTWIMNDYDEGWRYYVFMKV